MRLLNSVRNDVICKDRDLSFKNKENETSKFSVGLVVTYGPGFKEVKGLIQQLNDSLTSSLLFSDMETPVLGVATQRAPKLRDILLSRRDICLNTDRGSITTRCTPLGTRRVGTLWVLWSHVWRINTYNMAYIGRTVQPLGRSICKHPHTSILSINPRSDINDTNTPVAHAIRHKLGTKAGFNSFFKFYVLKKEEK